MIDLFFVKSFVAVAQTGSFHLAAQRNHVTQPAVSQHIRLLEQNLNCTLLERSPKKTVLTPAGKIFLVYAQQMLDCYQNAKTDIEKMGNLSIGSIRIASIYSIGLYQLKPIISHFLKRYPKINIHLEYCHNETVYQMMRDKVVDFGLVAFPKETKGFTYRIFTQDPLVMVQSSKRRFFKSKKISLKDLNNVHFISLDIKTPTGYAIDQFFKTHHTVLNTVKEYQNIETIKNAVEVGVGLSILPKTTVFQELKDKKLELLSLTGFNLKRPLAIVYNDKKVFSRAAGIFLNSISKGHGPV